MKNLLTGVEAIAIRAAAEYGSTGPGVGELLNRGRCDSRVTSARKYSTLRVTPGLRNYGRVMTDTAGGGFSIYTSVTLPRAPRCRGCGELLTAGQPVIVFSWWGKDGTTHYPKDSYLHASPCQGETPTTEED